MTSHSTERDKRRFLRVPKETAVTVNRLVYPLTDTAAEPAITKNMSEKGICFTATTLYHPNTLLNLKIELRGWQQHLHNVSSIIDASSLTKPLTAIAEVMWSREVPESQECEVGVYFKDIYEDEYQAFIKYLELISHKHTS